MKEKRLNINKKDFILKIKTRCNFSSKQAEEGVNAILDFLSIAFRNRQKIEIRGFGCFSPKKDGNIRFKSFIKF
jgi:nucleoid DNA-binding protein